MIVKRIGATRIKNLVFLSDVEPTVICYYYHSLPPLETRSIHYIHQDFDALDSSAKLTEQRNSGNDVAPRYRSSDILSIVYNPPTNAGERRALSCAALHIYRPTHARSRSHPYELTAWRKHRGGGPQAQVMQKRVLQRYPLT